MDEHRLDMNDAQRTNMTSPPYDRATRSWCRSWIGSCVLVAFGEFDLDPIYMRIREGMAVAREQGKLKGQQAKLSPKQQRELERMRESRESREYSITDLGELFSVPRPTAYRTINRTATE
jgi:DNA invertase Pin-like site-specific DNA recombinase